MKSRPQTRKPQCKRELMKSPFLFIDYKENLDNWFAYKCLQNFHLLINENKELWMTGNIDFIRLKFKKLSRKQNQTKHLFPRI